MDWGYSNDTGDVENRIAKLLSECIWTEIHLEIGIIDNQLENKRFG